MSTVPGASTYYCRHGIDVDYCSTCRWTTWQQWQHPCVAGHCGKCGAPYTADIAFTTGFGPPKFIPSCRCWNTG